MIPVVSYMYGDFIPTLTLADEQGTVEQLAADTIVHSVGRRVAAQDKPVQVTFNDQVLDPKMKVADAGIGPLDAIYLRYAP